MIEIGRKYEIINSSAGNDGLIVTVIGYAGRIPGARKVWGAAWFIDTWLDSNHGYKINYLFEEQLKPIDDGNKVITWEFMRDLWIPQDLEVLT